MRAMYPNRNFKVLIGAGALLALLLGIATYRAILAGCPESHNMSTLACLFLPTHTDIGVHLLSYVFIGTILLGISSVLVLWRRQWAHMRRLTRNLAQLRVPDSELEELIRCLGLEDKVHLLNSRVLLCFCAGFFSPRIYISRGMVKKLAPQELEALLVHEKRHLENYDPLKILLGRLLVAAIFFIPVLRDILKHYLIDKEIAADRSAIQYQGHYRGIAGVLEKLLGEQATITAEGLAAGGAEALSYRINHLMGDSSQPGLRIPIPHLATSFLITALILATIVAPLSGAHP